MNDPILALPPRSERSNDGVVVFPPLNEMRDI